MSESARLGYIASFAQKRLIANGAPSGAVEWPSPLSPDVQFVGNLLVEVRRTIPDHEFCGLGVLLCSEIADLPVLPLGGNQVAPNGATLIEVIRNASLLNGSSHDGFHVISRDLRDIRTNQFVSPPIPDDSTLAEVPRWFGARHMAAVLASRLPSVVCAGVMSSRNKVALFEQGETKAVFSFECSR